MKLFKSLGLYDGEEPSSKRIIGFFIIVYTMVIFAFNQAMQWEFLVTWLASGLVPFGITGLEKFRPAKPA